MRSNSTKPDLQHNLWVPVQNKNTGLLVKKKILGIIIHDNNSSALNQVPGREQLDRLHAREASSGTKPQAL